jgi:hypothetical protein
LPYLADVARLDRAWTEAHVAVDTAPLIATRLAGLTPDALGACRLAVHPAARWTWFADMPVASIWLANRPDLGVAVAQDLSWHAEGVVIARPHDAVHARRVGRDACMFLDACAEGADVATAGARVLAAKVTHDLRTTFARLLDIGAFAALSLTPLPGDSP